VTFHEFGVGVEQEVGGAAPQQVVGNNTQHDVDGGVQHVDLACGGGRRLES
jgi:hypothetical protein